MKSLNVKMLERTHWTIERTSPLLMFWAWVRILGESFFFSKSYKVDWTRIRKKKQIAFIRALQHKKHVSLYSCWVLIWLPSVTRRVQVWPWLNPKPPDYVPFRRDTRGALNSPWTGFQLKRNTVLTKGAYRHKVTGSLMCATGCAGSDFVWQNVVSRFIW